LTHRYFWMRKADEQMFMQTREQERQKRVEYFKQLDGYELPRENVYVI